MQHSIECNLCKKPINTKKERYTCVQDWEREKKLKEMWCHLSCFSKAMNRELNELEKQAKEMLARAKPIFDKIAPIEQEFEIK